jgi:DNA topoisomerase-1
MENSDLELILTSEAFEDRKNYERSEASAKAVHLIYTTDAETAGITRKKTGKKYSYYKDGEKIR